MGKIREGEEDRRRGGEEERSRSGEEERREERERIWAPVTLRPSYVRSRF